MFCNLLIQGVPKRTQPTQFTLVCGGKYAVDSYRVTHKTTVQIFMGHPVWTTMDTIQLTQSTAVCGEKTFSRFAHGVPKRTVLFFGNTLYGQPRLLYNLSSLIRFCLGHQAYLDKPYCCYHTTYPNLLLFLQCSIKCKWTIQFLCGTHCMDENMLVCVQFVIEKNMH